MCGIFASIGFAPDPDRIDIVAHRGPDGRGWQVFDSPAGPVALGHRRLAIIDTSDAGLQPMADPTGRYHLAFNGELYNYRELREELRAAGEIFTTESDSEVLLRAYVIWGEAALERLRGMFAILIWDDRDKVLFAARDRFGIKPLYYLSAARGMAFASEIKQLLGLGEIGGRMNVTRVHDFLVWGISDHTSETMFDGVVQLRAGECLKARPGSGGPLVATVRRWYGVSKPRGLSVPEEEAARRFHDLLEDSIRLHLRADVPIGSCLSGGLDSSSIVCLISRALGASNETARLNTVSACYAEKSVDEKPYMDAVVVHAATQPHFVFPRADDALRLSSDITWHQDEPFGSTSIFAQWCVFQEARRIGVKVMLDGQGADEQLAGYHSGYVYYLSGLLRRGNLPMLLRTVWERHRLHGEPVTLQLKRLLALTLPSSVKAVLRRGRRSAMAGDWLSSDVIRGRGIPGNALEAASAGLDLKLPKDIDQLCVMMVFASNLQMLLHWEDRNSMAHSIEARVPFLDHPLVEFSLALGNDHKMVGGETKRVLRRAMMKVLPEKVLTRRDKLGFATPEESWFKGPLRPMIVDGVEHAVARYPGLFNAKGARGLMRDMLDGRRPFDFALWRMVNLGLWGTRFGLSA
jgi:asparagine synthase (glutamine-hydrolysing)